MSWQDAPPGGEEAVQAVVCGTCGTTVGAQDEEEVVHFFNVLAS